MKVSMGVQSASSAGIALSSMSSSMGHMSPRPVLSEEEEIQRRVAEEVSKRFEEELRLLEHGRNRRLSAETTSVETSEEEIRRIADEMVKKRLDEGNITTDLLRCCTTLTLPHIVLSLTSHIIHTITYFLS